MTTGMTGVTGMANTAIGVATGMAAGMAIGMPGGDVPTGPAGGDRGA